MAVLTHLKPYPQFERHRSEMALAARQRRRRAVLAALLVAGFGFGAWMLHPALAFLVAGIGLMVLFFVSLTGSSSVPADQLLGIEGELRALDQLKRLPDDRILFNRLKVPDPWLPNGERELDFLVLGPDGLTVVEVKNSAGAVYVDVDQAQWSLACRGGCGSSPGWNRLDNPVRQVQAQCASLERWLLSHGLVLPIRAVVCFARPEVALINADSSPVPVVVPEQLPALLLTPISATVDSRQQQLAERILSGNPRPTPALAA